MNGSAIDSWTNSLLPAQHTSPWLKKMPLTTPSMAWSMGASSKMMLAALPPSSSVSALSVPGDGAADLLADGRRAGEGHLVHVGMLDEGKADLARPGDDVDHARRQVRLAAHVGEEAARSAASSWPA